MLNRLTEKIQANLLWILLLTAALNGLLYVYLIPPWEHYDEPGHFEYVWLTANLPHWPQEGDFDPNMRRKVAVSMIEHGFYNNRAGVPDVLSAKSVDIGFSQLRHMPIYYFIASIPLRFFHPDDISNELYAARLVSLLLFLMTIFFSYELCSELFSSGHPIRWMVPLFLSLLPPFVDLMTAVNNDAAAVASAMFFFWGAIRLIKNGIKPSHLLELGIGCVLCVFSKTTTIVLVPLAILAIVLAIFKNRQWLGWSVAIVAAISACFILFSPMDSAPAFFYSTNDQYIPVRALIRDAPVGKIVFVQRPLPQSLQSWFFMIPPNDLRKLRGKTATLGVWAWSSKPVDIITPSLQLYLRDQSQVRNIHLDSTPRFIALPFQIPRDASLGWFTVFGTNQPETTIYWNAWVLAEGDLSEAKPPIFISSAATQGIWGEKPFQNIILNASGKIPWPLLRPEIAQILLKETKYTSSYLFSLMDWEGFGWYYQTCFPNIFRTFWGKFGWAQINLTGSKPFRIFLILCFLSTIGLIITTIKTGKKITWTIIVFLGIALVLDIASVLLRGAGSWLSRIYIPVARYTYPVIISPALVFCLGWYGLGEIVKSKRDIWILAGLLFIMGLFMYDAWAVYSIAQFFHEGGL